MTRTKVGTIVHEAGATAFSLARHPVSTASLAVGLAKGTAQSGLALVRSVVTGDVATATPSSDVGAESVPQAPEQVAPEEQAAPVEQAAPSAREDANPAAPEDGPREPQVVLKPVPEIDELPEPIVIVAEDEPAEAFHTEPKAASRESEHGGPAGDREEAEGYVEEVVLDDLGGADPR